MRASYEHHPYPPPVDSLEKYRRFGQDRQKRRVDYHPMVYAPYGRTGLYMLQEFCRRIGIHANDEEIRDLIAALTALPPGRPLENLLREAPDFRQEAALADALLNPQDRSYSVPQLFDFIEKAGLTFGLWLKQSTLHPSLWSCSKDLAGFPAGTAFLRRAVCRRRTISRHNDSP